MGATRKDKKKTAQARAVKDGTAIPKDASGKPVKPRPPTAVCSLCKKEFSNIVADRKQIEAHAEAKHPKNTFAECFPTQVE